MINKSVMALPGIGPSSGGALIMQNITKAYQVYGEFLMYQMDSQPFMTWLKKISGARNCDALACYNALWFYSRYHL